MEVRLNFLSTKPKKYSIFQSLDYFLGRLINKLRANQEDDDIKKAAKKVYVKWKTHFVEIAERPMIEVKCDLKTEKLRNNARSLLSKALGSEVRI